MHWAFCLTFFIDCWGVINTAPYWINTAVCYTTLPYASYNQSFRSDNNTYSIQLPACTYICTYVSLIILHNQFYFGLYILIWSISQFCWKLCTDFKKFQSGYRHGWVESAGTTVLKPTTPVKIQFNDRWTAYTALVYVPWDFNGQTVEFHH